ncbi:hypothetical protein LAZ67_13001380 [Cordylochernes scorpioides]|uniref:Mariner Mos1 transposase n=1 Tax=Cordylochernes scorpioides TaxID=51811 RepID=A0ABY6L6A2_9ARAC|nr:hypothetical protein LAZ67_13001380 [Cordylochernes scorpioides]
MEPEATFSLGRTEPETAIPFLWSSHLTYTPSWWSSHMSDGGRLDHKPVQDGLRRPFPVVKPPTNDTVHASVVGHSSGRGMGESMVVEGVLLWRGDRSWADLVLGEVGGSFISVVGDHFFRVTVQSYNPSNGHTNENRTPTTFRYRTTNPALERALVTMTHQDHALQSLNKMSITSPPQSHRMVECSVGPAPRDTNDNIGKVPKGDWTKALVRRLRLDGRKFIKCRFEPSAALEDVLETLKLCYSKVDGREYKRGNEMRKRRRPQSTETTWRYIMDLITAEATADCLLLAAAWNITRNPEEVDFLQAAKFLDKTNKWERERKEASEPLADIPTETARRTAEDWEQAGGKKQRSETPTEKARRFMLPDRTPRCFTCFQMGHKHWDCPKKRPRERGGRPIKFEDAELEALLDEDSSQTQEELAETLGVTQQAISNRLKVMGMVQKQGNWVPYELKPGNIERHICTCELLLKRQNRKSFLHRIVTGDEKWIHYDNPKRKKSWVKPGHASTSTAKPNIHGKKLMLCIWWDQLGVIYYELLQPNETTTGELYQQQLMRLSRTLKIKRPLYATRHDKVIYQHDNSRPHVAKVVKETLEALQWDVLPHPLYSPDIAPSDYHMFRSMTHGLAEQHFTSYEEAKNWVNVWIASKDEEFFRHGIRMLPEGWEKVVAKDGQYFEIYFKIIQLIAHPEESCLKTWSIIEFGGGVLFGFKKIMFDIFLLHQPKKQAAREDDPIEQQVEAAGMVCACAGSRL